MDGCSVFAGGEKRLVFTNAEKMIIRYAIVYVLSFIAGLFGYYIFKMPYSDGLIKYINTYFDHSFNFNKSFTENLVVLFAVSFSDIQSMVYIFIAGFTMFSSIAIYFILIGQSLSLGFCSLYLTNAISSGVLDGVGFLDLVLYLFSSAAISSLILLYASKTKLFCERFRSIGCISFKVIKYKPLYIQIFSLLTFCGGIILINIIRFLFNLL